MSLHEIAQNTKVAIGAIVACLGSSVAAILQWIPEDIGKLGVVATITLTVILSIKHIRMMRLEEKKVEAEIRALNRDGHKPTRLETAEALLGSKE